MQLREAYPAEVTQGLPDQYVPKLSLVIACLSPAAKMPELLANNS